jgi:DNA-binding transcriptional LysR family regulator
MDQLDAMRAFVSVATLGSFAEAARRRRLSPSAVTRAVAQLEDSLGLTLLTRTTRTVRLTERGQIYLESCRQILEDVDAAGLRARGLDASPRGELRVAASILLGRLHVLPIVEGLLAAHPELAVRLTLSDRNVHLVEDGVDVAVRIGELADSSLISARLGAVSRVLVASPAYLARRGAPQTPAELPDHDLIAFEGLEITDEWRFRPGDAPVRIHPRLAVNSADASLVAAEGGLGIVRALSYQVVEALAAGRLVRVLEPFTPPPLPVSAVYPDRRIPSANVAAFMAAARGYFRARPVEAV